MKVDVFSRQLMGAVAGQSMKNLETVRGSMVRLREFLSESVADGVPDAYREVAKCEDLLTQASAAMFRVVRAIDQIHVEKDPDA